MTDKNTTNLKSQNITFNKDYRQIIAQTPSQTSHKYPNSTLAQLMANPQTPKRLHIDNPKRLCATLYSQKGKRALHTPSFTTDIPPISYNIPDEHDRHQHRLYTKSPPLLSPPPIRRRGYRDDTPQHLHGHSPNQYNMHTRSL